MKQIVQVASFALVLASTSAWGHGDEDPQGSAIGQPGESTQVSRTITVEMNDAMRFIPDNIAVKRGETIKFVVTNKGRLKHEMVLGSITELKEHAKLMRKFPTMEHAEPNQVSVEPGTTGEMIWQFTRTGKVNFACLQPGHFEAGMKGRVAIK